VKTRQELQASSTTLVEQQIPSLELSLIEAETNPALVYLAGLAPTGRRTMESTLRRIAELLKQTLETLPWGGLRYEHVIAIRTKLAEQYKPATVNKYLASIRGVMRAAWHLELIDAEHYQRIADVKGVNGATLPAGRGLSTNEIEALLNVCYQDTTPAGARDAAIIALSYVGGLRRAELVSLDLADVSTETDVGRDSHVAPIEALFTVKVLGKRSKERLIYLNDGAFYALRDWLKVRGNIPGPLFYPGRRGGHLVIGRRMCGQSLRDLLRRRARQANIQNVTPHDLRRSFVSDLLDEGVDISTVAAMAGHASIETTRRYDRRGEAAKQRGAKTLQLPYRHDT